MSDERNAGGAPEIAEYVRPGAPVRDAIGEEDNPIPLWFNAGFYGMIVFGIVYLLYYTLSGWSSANQYAGEVAAFEERYAHVKAAAPTSNPYHGDTAAIAAGQQVFTTICAACHKPDGTGLVGPSLVDPYWKYGSDDASLFESVANGRPGGMPAWGTQLGTEKIWQALAYAESLPRESEPGVGAPKPGEEPAP
ncbi:MAG: c-type cytochrome [Myxococcota bacterium]|nr:c-type cytochrome [Myxococcales bacterium]